MRESLFVRRAAARETARHDAVAVRVAKTDARYAFAKRALDLVVSFAVLVLASPVLAALAVAVRLDSPGPVVFSQQRVGRGGRTFAFFKFRTMHADARTRFPDLYAYRYTRQEFVDMKLKTADDPRLTRLGRRLRRTSLDEIPNLINVLKGDMSLVGPRPELPEMVGYYTEEELSKFSVRPGVTGLWQVSGRANLSNGLQLANDVAYVKRRSFGLDLAILAKTLRVVLFRVGAL